jgi:hypothetical protein
LVDGDIHHQPRNLSGSVLCGCLGFPSQYRQQGKVYISISQFWMFGLEICN